jgi:undecaprenyl phosphate N,N'-diacetylbacillosamine 1-phosphate transferase
MPASPIYYKPLKRAGDLLLAALALLALSPLMLAAALAIKLTSRGPTFFHQQRAGRAGRSFALIKFRTMLAGRTPDPKELVPLNHPDITTVGRLLRRTKIDELPQLFNVLAGHMSVVGPRPTLPDQIERYDLFERRRLHVRPGCTGLAQVNGNIALSWPERIKWDVYYVDNHSLWMDVKILLKTVVVIVAGEQRFVRHINQTDFAKDVGQ